MVSYKTKPQSVLLLSLMHDTLIRVTTMEGLLLLENQTLFYLTIQVGVVNYKESYLDDRITN